MKYRKIDGFLPTKAFLLFEMKVKIRENFRLIMNLFFLLENFDIRGTRDHKPSKHRPVSYKIRWLDQQNCLHFPLGRTIIETARPNYPFQEDGEIDLPFRNGAHCRWDNERLGNLDVFYRIGLDVFELIKGE